MNLSSVPLGGFLGTARRSLEAFSLRRSSGVQSPPPKPDDLDTENDQVGNIYSTLLSGQIFHPDGADYARDALAIVTYALTLDIPHITFDGNDGVLRSGQPWLVVPERLIHLIGSGATCTVSLHELEEAVADVVPAKTLVVLKRYHEPRSLETEDETKSARRLHSLVWQDLRTHTHPYLKTHENIVKLLYLAWQDDSLIPTFALEFAHYGTLDQFQDRNAGSITWGQSLSVSIDIATGVAALHACDMVHGDIKPANILVFAHESRGVIAKISDFVGVAGIEEFGSRDHIRFETEEWLAPEVFQRQQNIDWRKADVYAVGLVLAHIWYRGQEVGPCFLHHILSCLNPGHSELPAEEQIARLRRLKLMSSPADGSSDDHRFAFIVGQMNLIDWQVESDRHAETEQRHDTDATEPESTDRDSIAEREPQQRISEHQQRSQILAGHDAEFEQSLVDGQIHSTSSQLDPLHESSSSRLQESAPHWFLAENRLNQANLLHSSHVPSSHERVTSSQEPQTEASNEVLSTEEGSRMVQETLVNVDEGIASQQEAEFVEEYQPIWNIKRCINAALTLDPLSRCNASELVSMLYDDVLSQTRGQLDDTLLGPSTECRVEISKLPKKGNTLGKPLSLIKEFRQRSFQYQQLVLRTILRSLDTETPIPQCFLPDLNLQEQSNDLAVLKWFYSNNEQSALALSAGLQTYVSWVTLGEFALLGLGMLQNEQFAVSAWSKAAQGAMALPMASYTGIAGSCQEVQRVRSLERQMLWLSYGMRNGYRESMDVMRTQYPILYRTTNRILIGRALFSHPVESMLLGSGKTTHFFYNYLMRATRGLPGSADELFANASPLNRITALHAAAGFADIEMLHRILVQNLLCDINSQDLNGRTPAWYAVESEDPASLSFLLSEGADANVADGFGQSLLHRTTMKDDSTGCAMARLLVDYGAKLDHFAQEPGEAQGDVHTKYSMALATPLVWAAYRSRPKLFALLLTEHYKQDVPVQGALWMVILQRISIYHDVDVLESILAFELTSSTNPRAGTLFEDPIMQSQMLRFAVHESSHHSLGCRFELGEAFYPRQRAYLLRILSLGADPLHDGLVSEDSAVHYALSCGDKQAIQVFFEHLDGKGVIDTWKILATDEIPSARCGLLLLLRSKTITAFEWVLQRFPKVVHEQFDFGSGVRGSLLHLAIIIGGIEHVRALLTAGANRYEVHESTDATSLELAIENQKLDVADLLVEGADVPRLLGTPSKYGNTLFGRMLNRTFSLRKRIGFDTFRWLKKHDAIQFFPNILMTRLSLWRFFFSQRFAARRDIIDQDLRLLDFLTQPDTFLGQLHETDDSGQAAIHYAARWGNYESVKMLVEKGVDINQGVAHVEDSGIAAPATATALQFAVIASLAVPKDVQEGGAFVIKLWKEDCRKKAIYIEGNGGTRGKYERLMDRARYGTEWYDPGILVGESGLSMVSRVDEWQGQWPAKLSGPDHPPLASEEAHSELDEPEHEPEPAQAALPTEADSVEPGLATLNLQSSNDATITPDPDLDITSKLEHVLARIASGKGDAADMDVVFEYSKRQSHEATSTTPSTSRADHQHTSDALIVNRSENTAGPANDKPPTTHHPHMTTENDSEESADDEIQPPPSTLTTEEGVTRWLELLQQKRFRTYTRALVRVMREHGHLEEGQSVFQQLSGRAGGVG